MPTRAGTVAEERSVVNTEKLKDLRERANLSQEEAAQKIGLKYGTYVTIEQGRHVPKSDNLRSIARFFGVPMEALLR